MPQEVLPTPQQSVADRVRVALGLVGDGTSHPKQKSLSVAAFVFGLVAFILGFIYAAHLPGAIVGIVGFPLGLYSQMISATTGERWLNVLGIIGSFVGLALSLAHGGFTT
jgi:hypothetical protein